MAGEQAEEQAARDRLAFGLLVAFGVVTYAVPSAWIEVLAPLRLALVTSIGALGLMLLSRVGMRRAVRLDGLRGWMLILITVLSFASAAWAINPEGSRQVALDCAKYVAIYVTIVNLARTRRRLAILCGSLVLASIVTSIGVIHTYLGGTDLVEGFRARWVGLYADPNRMAMTVGIVVPLAVAFCVRREVHPAMRIASGAAAALAITAIVYSHSRGGFLGLAAAMILWALREKKLGRWALVGAAVVALAVLAPASFWNRAETVPNFSEDASALGRVHAWSIGAAISADRPLLGVGAGNFPYAWPLYAPPGAHKALEAHNIFLQAIAELGWIGFALFVLLVGKVIEGVWRAGVGRASAGPGDPWLPRALLASCVGYLVCSLSAGFLGNSPHLFVLFGLAAAAEPLWAPAAGAEPQAASAPSPH